MTVTERSVFRSTSLPEAPERLTRAEAEADEIRGIELEAYLVQLPTLTGEQWRAAWVAAWAVAQTAVQDAGLVATWSAQAIIVRDRISVKHFETLTAPMVAAGVTFSSGTREVPIVDFEVVTQILPVVDSIVAVKGVSGD